MSKVGSKKNTKMWRIRSMFLKELRLIQNDRFALLLIFILPTMIMATMYIATNPSGITIIPETGKNPDAMRLGIVDLDPTDTFPGEDLSENFTWYLTNSPDFIVQIFETEVEALDALYFDRVHAYAVIPYGFEGNITGDIPAFVDIHVSSTDLDAQMSVSSKFGDVVYQFRTDHGWSQREIATDMVSEFQPPGGGGFEATFGVFMIVFAVFIAVAATAAQSIVGDVPLNRMLMTQA
ncbi:MAG: ABC transporter permease, partial [Candidatus Thorarchaeota archaeon]